MTKAMPGEASLMCMTARWTGTAGAAMRAVLVLLVALALALMPAAMAHARAQALQPAASPLPASHLAAMADHCTDGEARQNPEKPLLSGESCAIACSLVLPAAPPTGAFAPATPGLTIAAAPPVLHGIAAEISLPPPRRLPEA